jgi:hypothetical protein
MACLLVLPIGLALPACANKNQFPADQMAEQAATGQADDDACRDKGAPGSETYNACRKGLADARAQAQAAAIKYQKARDFDRVLGAGTRGMSDNF